MGPAVDRGENCTGMTDLKKLFSNHFQENLLLQRQRSDLDYAKSKKLKELSHNEQLFMRKYEKYAMPIKKRRNSIDANLLRDAEANNSRPTSRLDDMSAQKALGRMAINSDCPYSMETWNMMVGVDKNFLEENKNTILHTDESVKIVKKSEDSPPVTPKGIEITSPLLSHRERVTNGVAIRKKLLTPLEEKQTNFDDDTIDEELVSIQRRRAAMPRRHSINPVSGCGLPKIQARRGSIDSTMLQRPQNRSGLLTPLRRNSKSDTDLSEGDGLELARSQSNIHNATIQKSPNSKSKSILKKVETNFDRPVATAAIFVRNDDGVSKRIDEHNESDDDGHSHQTNNDSCDKDNSDNVRLPEISENSCLTASQPERSDCKFSKSVSFNFEEMRSRSSSDASTLSRKSNIREMRHRRGSEASSIVTDHSPDKQSTRRHSMSTTALKLMVDSHHGAAKLRYIAKLARAMEKEAGLGGDEEEKEKPFADIENCRYLRVSKNGQGEC